MTDKYAKSNVEWTEKHMELFDKNGVKNIAKILVECKHLKFPTLQEIKIAEKNLELLDKQKLKSHKNVF